MLYWPFVRFLISHVSIISTCVVFFSLKNNRWRKEESTDRFPLPLPVYLFNVMPACLDTGWNGFMLEFEEWEQNFFSWSPANVDPTGFE